MFLHQWSFTVLSSETLRSLAKFFSTLRVSAKFLEEFKSFGKRFLENNKSLSGECWFSQGNVKLSECKSIEKYIFFISNFFPHHHTCLRAWIPWKDRYTIILERVLVFFFFLLLFAHCPLKGKVKCLETLPFISTVFLTGFVLNGQNVIF